MNCSLTADFSVRGGRTIGLGEDHLGMRRLSDFEGNEAAAALYDNCEAGFSQLNANRPYPPPSGVLCHYTDARGLDGILRDRAMRGTNIAYLNDSKEYKYFMESFHQFLVTGAFRYATSEEDVALIKGLGSRFERALLVPPIWVACFSEEADSLSQWRAYGGGEGGFAICFDPFRLETAAMQTGAELRSCHYSLDDHTATAVAIVQGALRYYRGAPRHFEIPDDRIRTLIPFFADALWAYLHDKAPLIKHGAFRDEQEWRLLKLTDDGDYSSVQFLPKQQMMSGYIPLHLAERDGAGLLPIKSITVGPSRHNELSVIAVRALLRKHGYQGVAVRPSKAPYRITV